MKYILLAVVAISLAACQMSEEAITPEIVREPIIFKSFLKEGNSEIPLSKAIGGDLNQGYHLGGAWTDGVYLTSAKDHFYPYLGVGVTSINDIKMRVDGTPEDPNAERLYWNTDGKKYHTFYAYTANPAETPAGCGITEVRKFDSYTDANQQGVSLQFKQPDDPMKQIDLLTADNSNIIVSSGTTSAVNLYFYHRLSKVSIKVFGTGGANLTNCQAKVTYNSTAPFSGVGSHNMAGIFGVKNGSGEYELSSELRMSTYPSHTGTYNLGHQFTVSNTQASEFDAVLAGSMIFVPQQLNTDGWATITLEYSVDGSSSRNTAKLVIPKLGQLYPTKECVLALNLIEYSQVLTVANVSFIDWKSKNEIIDNLPGGNLLSLSAYEPTDKAIPMAGKEYTITVNSNRGWVVGKSQYVTVSPTTGPKGITEVKITVDPNTTKNDRSAFAVFNTVGAVESMASSTWMGAQPVISYIEARGLYWAIGNLVADGLNGCRIGDANDNGLYFQFGSLIGWKGGETGDGVGRKIDAYNTYYDGTTVFMAANEVAVYPSEFTRLNDITNWPTDENTMLYYFNDKTWADANPGVNLSEYPNFASLADKGIGDPCSYYLKGKWRMPTNAEARSIFIDYGYSRVNISGFKSFEVTVKGVGEGAVFNFAYNGGRYEVNGVFGSNNYLAKYNTLTNGIDSGKFYMFWVGDYGIYSDSQSSGLFSSGSAARCVMDK